jgi:hypothetical protein
MNSRLKAHPVSYMQRESILNQKYSRKVNKPTIRNNLLNYIKNKQPETQLKKPTTSSSLYLSDQLKNFRKLSCSIIKDAAVKHGSAGYIMDGKVGSGKAPISLASKFGGYNRKNDGPNLFGLMNKRNSAKRSGSFDAHSNMSFTKRTASAKRKADILKVKHSKNKSMEIEPNSIAKIDQISNRKS